MKLAGKCADNEYFKDQEGWLENDKEVLFPLIKMDAFLLCQDKMFVGNDNCLKEQYRDSRSNLKIPS